MSRPSRNIVPPKRLEDYVQMSTTSDDSDGTSMPKSIPPMSESLLSLRSTLCALQNTENNFDMNVSSSLSLCTAQIEPVPANNRPCETTDLLLALGGIEQPRTREEIEAEKRQEEYNRMQAQRHAAELTEAEEQRSRERERMEADKRQAELAEAEKQRQEHCNRMEAQRRVAELAEAEKLLRANETHLAAETARRNSPEVNFYNPKNNYQPGPFRMPVNPAAYTPYGNYAHAFPQNGNSELMVQLLQSISDTQRDNHQFYVNEFRKINRRLDRMAETMEQEPEFPVKPDCLPIATREAIADFEQINAENYKKVVKYLADLGGYNLNETANLVVKHSLADSLSPSITWQGREKKTVKLQDTRLAKAFYAAITRNGAFSKPTMKEFTDAMTSALKSSEQRNRKAVFRQQLPRPRDEDYEDEEDIAPEPRRARRDEDSDVG